MNIDERLEALTMNLELAHRDIQDLRATVEKLVIAGQQHSEALRQDAEHIRALVRIAELHHERLERLEGKQ
jgi:hypothetical protein